MASGASARFEIYQHSAVSVDGAPWPRLVGVIPPQAECFQERGVLAETSAGAQAGGRDGAVLCQVLVGSGGVGKTQAAARYARARWSSGELDALVWLTAGNHESIVAQYARAAAILVAPEEVPADPQEAAQEFLNWLAATDRSWLVVFDDLADPGDLKGLWPPAHATGRSVVTTRRRDAALGGAGRQRVNLDAFTEEEAVAYVTAKLGAYGRDDDPEQVRMLARELGFLPIALAQAVTYLLDAALDCAGYRARWADRRRTLAGLVPQDGALPDDQQAGLTAVWSLSVQRADALEPAGLAGPMLELASMLDPNGVPLEVLTTPPALRYAAKRRRALATAPDDAEPGRVVDEDDAQDALAALARLSLCALEPRNPHRAVRVHALVQRATREALPAQRHSEVAHAAADALLAAWPQIERDSTLSLALRDNAESLSDNSGDALWEPEGHEVLFRAGASIGESGLVGEAAAFFDRLHQQATVRLGPDHPDTLTARHALVNWRGEARNPATVADTVAAFEQLLADRVRLLGPGHSDTLETRHKLAYWQGKAGDPAAAAAALELLLGDRVRALGADHPRTLDTRHDLAFWRGEAGDLPGAISGFEALLADYLRVHGPDHPDTLTNRHNIAHWRGEAGDVSGALAAFETLLSDCVRVLGPDHRRTLTARGNLAYQRGEAGDPPAAAAELEALVADCERVLGPEHPHTFAARHDLAYWRREAKDLAGAIAACHVLLTDCVRVLGPEHPRTLGARQDLAYWRGEAGEPTTAAAALEELLADCVRVLGPDHSRTLAVRSNLARWLGESGQPAAAAATLEGLLADCVRILGPDHRRTLITRENHAYWRRKVADSAREGALP